MHHPPHKDLALSQLIGRLFKAGKGAWGSTFRNNLDETPPILTTIDQDQVS